MPTHSFDRVLPLALHVVQGNFVLRVTASDHSLICRPCALITSSAVIPRRGNSHGLQVATRHDLHTLNLPPFVAVVSESRRNPRKSISRLLPDTEHLHGCEDFGLSDQLDLVHQARLVYTERECHLGPAALDLRGPQFTVDGDRCLSCALFETPAPGPVRDGQCRDSPSPIPLT